MDLKERMSKLTPEQRELLELKLRQRDMSIDGLPIDKGIVIEPVEEMEYYPLSLFQKRLYILNLFSECNMAIFMEVEGILDKNRFEVVFRELIKRHESLRTSVEMIDEKPVQRIHEFGDVDFEIEYCDLTGGGTGGPVDTEMIGHRIQHLLCPFDLSKPPLLRVELVKLSRLKHLFLVNMHHVIADGVSTAILRREFFKLYQEETVADLSIRYRDFSRWQNRVFERGEYKKQEAYWLKLFANDIPVLNLPTDYPRPAMQSFKGRMLRFYIEGKTFQALKKLTLRRDLSFFMVLLAVTYVLLFRYTYPVQEDIVIGTIVSERQQKEVENIIGAFINPLALRNYPTRDKPFGEFLSELKENTLKAYENQLYPFGDLLEKVVKKKDLSRNPLFDVMWVFQNRDIGHLEIEGVQFSLYQLKNERESELIGHAQQDITFWAEEREEKISIDLEYCTALFKHQTMERFVHHFLNILGEAAANPGLKLSEIGMVGQEEKQRLLRRFNSTEVSFPMGKRLHQLFEEQVKRTPDRIALVGMEPGEEASGHTKTGFQYLTYRELSEKSNQLARVLEVKGVKHNTIVGVMLDRSIKILIAVLGVLKAEAAYLPIDPYYPRDRIDYILADSSVRVVVTELSEVIKVSGDIDVIDLNKIENIATYDGGDLSLRDHSHLHLQPAPVTSLSYVIYTSGSTGRPKGVIVQHDSFVNAAFAWIKEYRLEEIEVNLLQMASFSFDVFSGDIVRALLTGGKLVVCSEEVMLELTSLHALIVNQKITLFESTPALILPLMEYVHENELTVPYLQLLIVGSDVCPAVDFQQLVSRFGNQVRIINSYGLTEATIDTSYYEKETEDIPLKGNVPIGKPLPNMQFYILNIGGRIQPVGVPGELYVGGKGVAQGYLNRPELTAEKFIDAQRSSSPCALRPVPCDSTRSGVRVYRTGDLARWLDDGNVEFLGRIDHQIKIRGFRVELGEIENQLLNHTFIKEAIVLDKEDINGNKYLCAYIVPAAINPSENAAVSELRTYLSGTLPAYMIPAIFIVLDRIPLTPNGKVDMETLYSYDSEENIVTGIEYEAPGNEVEMKLAEMWAEVLMKDRIGIYDNFFDLGGQSILAMRMVSRIKEIFNVKIPLIDIFQGGTIRGIAEIILDMQSNKKDSVEESFNKKGLSQLFELDKSPLRTPPQETEDNLLSTVKLTRVKRKPREI